jgi:hypothetical protein
MAAGQCTYDPVTGIAGAIFNDFLAYLNAGNPKMVAAAAVFGTAAPFPGPVDNRRAFIASLAEPIAAQIWAGITGGTVTSIATSAPLTGGPITTSGTIGFKWTVTAESMDFTAALWTHYRVDTTGGDVTATLPSPSGGNAGQDISLIKTASANNLIVASTALINGASSQTLSGQWDKMTVRSTGTTWDVVA